MMENESHKASRKEKPWGYEIWFAQNEDYAGKVLFIKKGHRYSLQYHEKKRESQYIYCGQAKLTFGTEQNNLKEMILQAGDKFDVLPYLIHRVEALEDTTIFEVSTPELDDVVKLADDYGRTGKGNNHDLDQQLSQKNSPNQS